MQDLVQILLNPQVIPRVCVCVCVAWVDTAADSAVG